MWGITKLAMEQLSMEDILYVRRALKELLEDNGGIAPIQKFINADDKRTVVCIDHYFEEFGAQGGYAFNNDLSESSYTVAMHEEAQDLISLLLKKRG